MNHKLIWDRIAELIEEKTAMLSELIDMIAHEKANYKLIKKNYANESAKIDAEINRLLEETTEEANDGD